MKDYFLFKSSFPPIKILIVGFFLVLPLLYCSKCIDPVLVPRLLGISVLILLVALFILISVINNKIELNHSLLKLSILKSILLYIIFSGTSIIFAINKYEAITELFKLLIFFSIFLLSILTFNNFKDTISFLSKMITVFAGIILLVGLYQFIKLNLTSTYNHQSSYQIISLLGHRNLFAQIILLSFPFTMYNVFTLKNKWRIISVFICLLILPSIIILLTRSVWMALALSIFGTLIIMSIFYKKFILSIKILKKIRVIIGISFIVIGISLFFYSRLDSFTTLKKQTVSLTNFKFGSSLERIKLWKKSVEMFKEAPLFGKGIGNWKLEIPKYGNQGISSDTGNIFFQRPHNDFLWVLSEAGIFAALFYVGIFIFFFIYVFKILKYSNNTQELIFTLLMAFAMISFIVISFFSFPKERATHLIFLNFIIAPISVLYHKIIIKEKKSHNIKSHNIILLSVIILVSIISISIFSKKCNAEIHTKKAFHAMQQKNWKNVIYEINKGYSVYAQIDPTSTPLLWYRGSAYFNQGKIDNALSDFKEAYKQSPYHIHVLNNLATCYEIKGNHKKAEIFYLKSIYILPSFKDAIINLSAVYYNVGRLEDACRIIQKYDYNSKDKRYQSYLKIIITARLKEISQNIDDLNIKKTVLAIMNNYNWTKQIFIKSIKNNTNFKNQIIVDAIYTLEIIDKKISNKEVLKLKNKYL